MKKGVTIAVKRTDIAKQALESSTMHPVRTVTTVLELNTVAERYLGEIVEFRTESDIILSDIAAARAHLA